jgi:ATP-binding cassette, subfamily B, bacterial PglK
VAGMPGLMGAADLRTVAAVCGVVYVVKNGLMLALAWVEARLAFGVQSHLSVHTLTAMMRQDYEEASRANQSARVNLLTGGMYALAFNVLLPGLTLLAEATLMLALVLFLVLTQPPFVSGMLAALCAVAGALVLVSRRLVLRLGATRHRSEDDKLQLVTGIFGHLREMYVYSAAPRAVAHLEGMLARLAATYRGFQLLQTTPRFLLELALVGVLLVVVFWQAGAGMDPTLVVSIGVFGVAGFRLLLGINRVVGCVQAMRFAGPTIERITEALDIPAGPAAAARHASRGRAPAAVAGGALRLVGISYAYAAGKPVLRGVDFELPRCSLVAIKGRSGAGKSTLLEILAGLRTPSEGWVELDGQRIAHKQELVGRIAYAGQQPAVFPDTIRANVAFGLPPGEIDDQAVWRALARARLDEVVRALPGQLDHRLAFTQTLSGGQVQRLALARALYMDCDYLLLDEPTAALDAETEMQCNCWRR